MRNINRAPIVSAIICYYDTSYEYETAVRVLAILKKYNFFTPEKIHADYLTKNKYIYILIVVQSRYLLMHIAKKMCSE